MWSDYLISGIVVGFAASAFVAYVWNKISKRKFLGTKRIKTCGMIFHIRKINPIDYLDGSIAVKQAFELYVVSGNQKESPMNTKKIKTHYIDVLCAGVVEPKLVRKEKDQVDGAIWVENLFTEWQLVDDLYTAIYSYTYGKKKMRQLKSLGIVS